MVAQEKRREVTWTHFVSQGIGLFIAILIAWVDMKSTQAAQGRAMEDYNKSQAEVMESIRELRIIQMEQISKTGELKGIIEQMNREP